MLFVPIICLALGILLGFIVSRPTDITIAPYMAVACLAALDTAFGGFRSALEDKFRQDIFLTGFFANVFLAFFFAWLGERIGVNISLASALIFGSRIFNNLSLIRRYLLTSWHDHKERAQQAVPPNAAR